MGSKGVNSVYTDTEARITDDIDAAGKSVQVRVFQRTKFRAFSITTPICRTPVDYFQERGSGYEQSVSGDGPKVRFLPGLARDVPDLTVRSQAALQAVRGKCSRSLIVGQQLTDCCRITCTEAEASKSKRGQNVAPLSHSWWRD